MHFPHDLMDAGDFIERTELAADPLRGRLGGLLDLGFRAV